jgi:hypothetical protein
MHITILTTWFAWGRSALPGDRATIFGQKIRSENGVTTAVQLIEKTII